MRPGLGGVTINSRSTIVSVSVTGLVLAFNVSIGGVSISIRISILLRMMQTLLILY